jgi:hypothetical protein
MAQLELRAARAFFFDGRGQAEDFFSVVLDIDNTWTGWRTVWSNDTPSTPRQQAMSPHDRLTAPVDRSGRVIRPPVPPRG